MALASRRPRVFRFANLGGVAQLVERHVRNVEVGGSSPLTSTYSHLHKSPWHRLPGVEGCSVLRCCYRTQIAGLQSFLKHAFSFRHIQQRQNRERTSMSKGDRGQCEVRFRTLYEMARPRVLAYALRRTTSSEDAADIVAETFAVAWRRLEEIPEGEESILWFYATARRVLANHYRRTRRRSELIDRVGSHLNGAFVSEENVGDDRMSAVAALRRLDDDDRELLMLASWEGLDSADLSRLLGCSRTAVRLRLHRARTRLAGEMESLGLVAKQPRSPRHSLLRAPLKRAGTPS
jgi:RNA polymerase sigma factor (sigma-70 family)